MLIKNGIVVEDHWVTVSDDAAIPDDRPAIVPLDRWRRERASLDGRDAPLGVRLASHDTLDEIDEALRDFDLVALEFPAFTDGRSYSTARLLRERHGYTGELRAVGQILRDQAQFMARCGFDTFELPDDARAGAWPTDCRTSPCSTNPSPVRTHPSPRHGCADRGNSLPSSGEAEK